MHFEKKHVSEIVTLCYISVVYLWMDNFYAAQRFNAIGFNVQGNFGIAEYLRQAVFIVEHALGIFAIYFASRLKKPWSFTLLLVGWALTTVDLVTHGIYGRPADLANISVLNASIANLTDATQEYSSLILLSIVKTGVLFVPLLLKSTISKASLSFGLYLLALFYF